MLKIVYVLGIPGIGKSFIVNKFIDQCDSMNVFNVEEDELKENMTHYLMNLIEKTKNEDIIIFINKNTDPTNWEDLSNRIEDNLENRNIEHQNYVLSFCKITYDINLKKYFMSKPSDDLLILSMINIMKRTKHICGTDSSYPSSILSTFCFYDNWCCEDLNEKFNIFMSTLKIKTCPENVININVDPRNKDLKLIESLEFLKECGKTYKNVRKTMKEKNINPPEILIVVDKIKNHHLYVSNEIIDSQQKNIQNILSKLKKALINK